MFVNFGFNVTVQSLLYLFNTQASRACQDLNNMQTWGWEGIDNTADMNVCVSDETMFSELSWTLGQHALFLIITSSAGSLITYKRVQVSKPRCVFSVISSHSQTIFYTTRYVKHNYCYLPLKKEWDT